MSDTTNDELQRQATDLEEFAAESHELQDLLGVEGVEHLHAASLDAAAEVRAEIAAENQPAVDPMQWFHDDLPALIPRDGDLEFGVACRRAVAAASSYVGRLPAERVEMLTPGMALPGSDTPVQAATRLVLGHILQGLEPTDVDRRRVAPKPVGHDEMHALEVMLTRMPGTAQSPQLFMLLATVTMTQFHPELVGDDLGVMVESLIRYHLLLVARRAATRPMDVSEWEQLRGLLTRAATQIDVTFKDATGDAAAEGVNLRGSIDNIIALAGAEIEFRRRQAEATKE